MSVILEHILVNRFASMKMAPTPANVTLGTAWMMTDKVAQVRNIFNRTSSHCGVNALIFVFVVQRHYNNIDKCICL